MKVLKPQTSPRYRSWFWSALIPLFLTPAVKPQNNSEIVPPVSLVHEGVPPIPASLGKDTLPYRSSAGPSLIGWDPEKPQPLIADFCMNEKCASLVPAPGEPRRFLAKLPSWYREIIYDPQGRFLIYTKPVDENFQDQIYRYDIDKKESTLLTDGKSRNRYPLFSSSGKLISFSSNRRNGRDLDVYAMDPLNPKSTRLLAKLEGEDWAVFDWSPDDRKVILSDYKSYNETYLYVLDLESGRKRLLTPPRGSEKIFNGSYAFFGKDSKGIYFITDRDSEFRRLVYLDLANQRTEVLSASIKWDVTECALAPDGKTIAYISNEDGIGRLHLLNVANRKKIPTPDMPPGVISGLMWHPRLPYIGFTLSTAKFASRVFSVSLATHKLEQWTTAYYPIKADSLKEPEIIKWPSFDGRFISGFLYRPPGTFEGKRPVIIDIHGGPAIQFRPDFRGEDNYFVQALGIAYIYPNVRGSSGFGKTFMDLDDGLRRADAVKDIGRLLHWISTRPELDSHRILLKGTSSGGYLALSAAEAYPTRISGVISYSAPTNLVTFIEHSGSNEPDAWRREFGDERDPKIREFLEKTAPVNNADQIRVPVFLVLGGKDLMTSVSETERIVSVLRAKDLPVWFLLSKDEAHGLVDLWTYNYAFNAQVLFVKKYLTAD